MKAARRWFIAALCALATAALAPTGEAAAACRGRFANPITDICWSCIFPLKLGGFDLATFNQESWNTGIDDFVCACPGPPPTIGVTAGFWEPVRMVEVVAEEYCFPSLGGIKLDPGLPAHDPGDARHNARASSHLRSRHAHWYVNPVLYWLQVMFDNSCIERQDLDIAFMTELDPSWDDPELGLIVSPETALIANPAAILACSADCVAAAAGFPLQSLWWCAGCDGVRPPLTGYAGSNSDPLQDSTLFAQRLADKLHRSGATRSRHGNRGLCGPFFAPYNKRQYKFSMIWPNPTVKSNSRCCNPFGRPASFWGIGVNTTTEQNQVYMLYRKIDCCMSVF